MVTQLMCLKPVDHVAGEAVDMDQDGPESPLQGEEACFNGHICSALVTRHWHYLYTTLSFGASLE